MYAAPLVAEKRSFEVDAERRCCIAVAGSLSRFDGVGQARERGAGLVKRRGDGGGEVSGDAVGDEKLVQARQFGGRGAHDVEAGAAVHVDVDETGGQDCAGNVRC